MKQKTVLITGASRGIGRASAAAFAKAGYNLILNCIHNKELLTTYVKELSDTYGIFCISFTGDISDYKICEEMFAKAKEAFGGVDVLINNAGISYVGLLSEMTFKEWNHVIGTNLTSVFNCSKLAIPYMVSKKEGKIINVSSVWGCSGASCEAAYSASKGGINALTQALAKELAPSNIQVNAVACGAIATEMNNHLSKEELQSLADEIPAGRMGTPKEVADYLLQLAEAPSYLTGQIIKFDGAWI